MRSIFYDISAYLTLRETKKIYCHRKNIRSKVIRTEIKPTSTFISLSRLMNLMIFGYKHLSNWKWFLFSYFSHFSWNLCFRKKYRPMVYIYCIDTILPEQSTQSVLKRKYFIQYMLFVDVCMQIHSSFVCCFYCQRNKYEVMQYINASCLLFDRRRPCFFLSISFEIKYNIQSLNHLSAIRVLC